MAYRYQGRVWDDIPARYPLFNWKDNADLLADFFQDRPGNSAKRNSQATFSQKPLEVFPGKMSWDLTYQKVLADLASELTRVLPEEVDELGRVGPSGIRSNFFGLRHLVGAPMVPATFVLGSNVKKRSDAGLASGPVSKIDEYIFRCFIRKLWSGYENKGLRLARGTSSGAPFYDKRMGAKLDIALRALDALEVAGDMVANKEYREAYKRFGVGGIYTVLFREQTSDKVSFEKGRYVAKARTIADSLYASTGGAEGQLMTASKSTEDLRLAGHPVLPDMFRTRRRVAEMGPLGTNSIIMAFVQPIREAMYKRYGFSFHHTTAEQKQEKLSAFDSCIMTDVSDHDTMWPASWLVPMMVDELRDMGYPHHITSVIEQSFRLGAFVTAISPHPEECNILIGDPYKCDLAQGLPSGNGITDMAGTTLMSPTYAIAQLDHIAIEEKQYLIDHIDQGYKEGSVIDQWVEEYLTGKRDIGQLSKSDDAALVARGSLYQERAEIAMQKAKDDANFMSPYMIIQIEHGGALLGHLAVYDSTKQLKNVKLMPNIISYVNNLFVPEYGIQTHLPREKRARPFPGLAVGTAFEVYGSAPGWQVVNEVIEKVWFKHYRESFREMRKRMFDEDVVALKEFTSRRLAGLGGLNLSLLDLEVLAEPSKMSWKFTHDEIHPSIVELFSSGLSVDQTAKASRFMERRT